MINDPLIPIEVVFISTGDGETVFGDIVCFHIADEIMVNGRVRSARLLLVGKLNASNFATVYTVERLILLPE
jgi:hypothetical protein